MIDSFVEVDGSRLRIRTWGEQPPSIVFLHHGLGSVSQWGAVPEQVHRMTGRSVLAYDRSGHGRSTPLPVGPWPADWLHTEADVLDALLAVLASDRPLLVGHSDGASIALIRAATRPAAQSGVIALSPHSYVEERCVEEIAGMRTRPQRLVRALADHHVDAGAVFEAWSGVWVSEEFGHWDIRRLISGISAPTLVVQGDSDAYGTDGMLWSTVAAIGPSAEGRLLSGLGHLLHHEAPDLVCELVAGYASTTP